jgi:hypothetical protein
LNKSAMPQVSAYRSDLWRTELWRAPHGAPFVVASANPVPRGIEVRLINGKNSPAAPPSEALSKGVWFSAALELPAGSAEVPMTLAAASVPPAGTEPQ